MDGFLNPDEILKQLKLKQDMVAVDFGCGAGGWVIPLAEKLPEGKIYAIDILEEPLSALEGKAKQRKIFNIETIQSNLEIQNGLKIDSDSVDLILITNFLFQVENKAIIFEKAEEILKKNGRIIVVDWRVDARFGPQEGRISSEDVKRIAKEFNLKIEKEFSASFYHYGLIFLKK